MPLDDLKYSHVLSYVRNTPWAITVDKLAVILDLVAFRSAGGTLTAEEITERISAASRPVQRNAGAIAVLPLFGTIVPRMGMMSEASGGISTERFALMFRQAMADPQVGAVVIDVDSPGGAVTGVQELASEVYGARGGKPIVAIANSLAASAAYWIATAADSVSVTPTGEVGSIGVFVAHQDRSAMLEQMGVKTSLINAGKYKVEGNPFEPLSDDARAAIQERVDEYYGMFVDSVARNRGVSSESVRDGFGEGRVVGAKRAQKLGMVDRVETMNELMSRMMRQVGKGAARASDESPIVVADITPPDMGLNDLDLRRRKLRLAARQTNA